MCCINGEMRLIVEMQWGGLVWHLGSLGESLRHQGQTEPS